MKMIISTMNMDLAAEIVRQAAEADGADENAEQARGADHPVLAARRC